MREEKPCTEEPVQIASFFLTMLIPSKNFLRYFVLSLPSLPTTPQHWQGCWTLIIFHMRICSRCLELCLLLVAAISPVIDMTASLLLGLPLLTTAWLSIPLVPIPSSAPTAPVCCSLLLQTGVSHVVTELSHPAIPEALGEFSAQQIVGGTLFVCFVLPSTHSTSCLGALSSCFAAYLHW